MLVPLSLSIILKTNTMSTFKKAKVVMLPTEQNPTPISIGNVSKIGEYHQFLFGKKEGIYNNHTFQHLYIISDDEIKEGDWYYSIQGNRILQATIEDIDILKRTPEILIAYKKIIATTDSSLWRPSHKYASDVILLPQPSQQFIEKFVEKYNKGNVITDVLVEYELISNEEYFLNTINPDDDVPYFDERLTINPKDNTITIKKVKDSYTKEEHISNIKKFSLELGSKIHCFLKEDGTLSISIQDVNKWIEENL